MVQNVYRVKGTAIQFNVDLATYRRFLLYTLADSGISCVGTSSPHDMRPTCGVIANALEIANDPSVHSS